MALYAFSPHGNANQICRLQKKIGVRKWRTCGAYNNINSLCIIRKTVHFSVNNINKL